MREYVCMALPEETGAAILRLGLVRSVFRGALVKAKDAGPRKLKSSRPAIHALTLTSCSRVRLVVLSKLSNHRWWCSSFSHMVQLDPLGTVVAEMRVRVSFEQEGKVVFVFGDRAVKALAKWESSPQLLEDKMDKPAKTSESVECEPQQVESRLYSHSDFARSKDGNLNIREFLKKLPALYVAREMPILSPEGTFKFRKACGASSEISWNEVVYLDGF